MDQSKERFEKLIEELIELGEDREELEFWLSIYDNLADEKKEKLIDNLTREAEELKKAQ